MEQRKELDFERVLITGGCGFIGSNLLQLLIKSSAVRVFDNHPGRSYFDVKAAGADLIVGDIRDFDALVAAIQECDAVIHLAASGSVVDSVENPYENFDNNALGTLRVLQAAKGAGVKRVILASTGGALIGEAEPPVHEQSLPKPISPYGASKLCGEAYGFAFHKAYGLDVVALRFANVYGPWSAHKKGAITAFIKNLMRENPITIYGDGAATRDFLYVDDLCEGIIRALATPAIGGEVFHLASAVETSVAMLSKMLCETAGKPNHQVQYEDRRSGEVSRNFARYEKAKAVLGFEPKWNLEEGLNETWNWFQRFEGDSG